MPRLFTGLELPGDVRDALIDIEQPLTGASWIDAGDLHLTLRFFGDVSEETARDLADLLDTTAAGAFPLKIAGIGSFGAEPHSLYAAVEPNPALDALARAHDRIARGLGLPNAKRPWKPHVTLARLHHADPIKLARVLSEEALFALDPIFVHRYALFSSHPRTGGGPYVVEAHYPLRGGLGTGNDEDGNPW